MMALGLAEHLPLERHSATVPVTCGVAMLVPAIVKLLKSAAVSSTSARQVAAAPPPGCPLKSTIAVTVSTSLYAAGVKLAKSPFELPAATTYVTPAATELQIAACMASPLLRPQFPSSEPLPPKLILATLMRSAAALALTQSMPHTTDEVEPEPLLFRTRTAYSRTPGAIPTTPLPSSRAPMVPATCVPWPLPSSKLRPVEQLWPPATF